MSTGTHNPAQAVFAMDKLSDLVKKRWPEETGETADIIERLLLTVPPGKGAIIMCEAVGCNALATHRLTIERAIDSLHLKYNGKPANKDGKYDPGVRKGMTVCEACIEPVTAAFIVDGGKDNPSVSVTAIKKD